jgi:1-acyl-sn-glycerol-3-phosphate acyltransferase
MIILHALVCAIVHGMCTWMSYWSMKQKDNPDKCNEKVVNFGRRFLETAYGAQFRGKININSPTLYLLPHASQLDFLIIASIHPKCRYVTKPGVLKLPLASFSAQKGQHIIVDVKDSQSRSESKQRMKELFEQGYSVAIFPEGKLRKNQKIGTFFPGGIQLACELQIPICTVCISGFPFHVLKSPKKQPCVLFHPPVVYSNVESAIADVRYKMKSGVDQFQKPPRTIQRLCVFLVVAIVITRKTRFLSLSFLLLLLICAFVQEK